MTEDIVAHAKPNTKRLRAHRAKLMTELCELEGLSEHQLRRRYYVIHPLLKSVCRELSTALTAEGVGRIRQQNTLRQGETNGYYK